MIAVLQKYMSFQSILGPSCDFNEAIENSTPSVSRTTSLKVIPDAKLPSSSASKLQPHESLDIQTQRESSVDSQDSYKKGTTLSLFIKDEIHHQIEDKKSYHCKEETMPLSSSEVEDKKPNNDKKPYHKKETLATSNKERPASSNKERPASSNKEGPASSNRERPRPASSNKERSTSSNKDKKPYRKLSTSSNKVEDKKPPSSEDKKTYYRKETLPTSNKVGDRKPTSPEDKKTYRKKETIPTSSNKVEDKKLSSSEDKKTYCRKETLPTSSNKVGDRRPTSPEDKKTYRKKETIPTSSNKVEDKKPPSSEDKKTCKKETLPSFNKAGDRRPTSPEDTIPTSSKKNKVEDKKPTLSEDKKTCCKKEILPTSSNKAGDRRPTSPEDKKPYFKEKTIPTSSNKVEDKKPTSSEDKKTCCKKEILPTSSNKAGDRRPTSPEDKKLYCKKETSSNRVEDKELTSSNAVVYKKHYHKKEVIPTSSNKVGGRKPISSEDKKPIPTSSNPVVYKKPYHNKETIPNKAGDRKPTSSEDKKPIPTSSNKKMEDKEPTASNAVVDKKRYLREETMPTSSNKKLLTSSKDKKPYHVKEIIPKDKKSSVVVEDKKHYRKIETIPTSQEKEPTSSEKKPYHGATHEDTVLDINLVLPLEEENAFSLPLTHNIAEESLSESLFCMADTKKNYWIDDVKYDTKSILSLEPKVSLSNTPPPFKETCQQHMDVETSALDKESQHPILPLKDFPSSAAEVPLLKVDVEKQHSETEKEKCPSLTELDILPPLPIEHVDQNMVNLENVLLPHYSSEADQIPLQIQNCSEDVFPSRYLSEVDHIAIQIESSTEDIEMIKDSAFFDEFGTEKPKKDQCLEIEDSFSELPEESELLMEVKIAKYPIERRLRQDHEESFSEEGKEGVEEEEDDDDDSDDDDDDDSDDSDDIDDSDDNFDDDDDSDNIDDSDATDDCDDFDDDDSDNIGGKLQSDEMEDDEHKENEKSSPFAFLSEIFYPDKEPSPKLLKTSLEITPEETDQWMKVLPRMDSNGVHQFPLKSISDQYRTDSSLEPLSYEAGTTRQHSNYRKKQGDKLLHAFQASSVKSSPIFKNVPILLPFRAEENYTKQKEQHYKQKTTAEVEKQLSAEVDTGIPFSIENKLMKKNKLKDNEQLVKRNVKKGEQFVRVDRNMKEEDEQFVRVKRNTCVSLCVTSIIHK